MLVIKSWMSIFLGNKRPTKESAVHNEKNQCMGFKRYDVAQERKYAGAFIHLSPIMISQISGRLTKQNIELRALCR